MSSCSQALYNVETVHDIEITPVFGVGNTFFFEPLDGIVRMEAEYFNREPGFIPNTNLGVNAQIGETQRRAGSTHQLHPRSQDRQEQVVRGAGFLLRWELGSDRFFFFRPLNPTNSFTWVTGWSWVPGTWTRPRKGFPLCGPVERASWTTARDKPWPRRLRAAQESRDLRAGAPDDGLPARPPDRRA